MAAGSTSPDQAERVARAALTCVAEPGDPAMGALLKACSPQEVVAALTEGREPLPDLGSGTGASVPLFGAEGGRAPVCVPGLTRAWPRWSARLGEAPTELDLDAWRREGIRLVVPGDAEWPGQLDVLGDARPWALWVRGNSDLRYACLRSVSLVGTRVATAYGAYVCTEMAVTLAERGWTIVSGGAYGIDSCAHRGALAVEGSTIAVLACGVDYTYPRGHHDLFQAVYAAGASVSEWPPGRAPTRPGFLVRNRVIAALSRGTVVVEAALRSGALNTARHARDQNRLLMAVPGPVTSPQSAGCHEIIREWGAVCVTSAYDVIELLSFPDGDLGERERGAVLPRDELDPVVRKVLEAVPARAGRGPARIAIAAGLDLDTAMRCLGALAAAGFVERCDHGWRVRKDAERAEFPPP
jgi:DNA processing protein